jgi:hypothetical protein
MVQSLVLPGLSHGVDFGDPYAQAWFIGIPLAFFSLALFFRALNWWDFKLEVPRPGDKKLVESSTRASDDMAFELVAGGCCVYLACAGSIATFNLFGVDIQEKLARDPFYAHDDWVTHHLILPMFFYQAWNVVICFQLDVLGDFHMILHHLVAASLSYCALAPYLHMRAIFFFGVIEITSIPLTVYDVCKKFSRLGWKNGLAYQLSQGLFGLSFIAIRLVIWPCVCVPFWLQSLALLAEGRQHSTLVVVWFLFSNVLMTGLQVYWGRQVVAGVLKLLFPSSSSDKRDD